MDIEKDKPILTLSSHTDKDQKDAENEMLKAEYKHELGLFIKRKQEYKDNSTKAYALLWAQCSKAM